MPASPSSLPRIPGYALGRVLGWGGRSVVYEAVCEEVDDDQPEEVALKVLTPRGENDKRAVRLFRRELAVGLRVSHPHLVKIFGGNGFTKPYYIVMEKLAGESLRHRLARLGQLEIGDAMASARQVAAALVALHNQGFVHADVKPENVRVVAPGLIKLVDLGFAHLPGGDSDLHSNGHVMGTANYLAPEMCVRPPKDGPAVDIFALGVMAFELLTGHLPYEGRTSEEVVRNHRYKPPAKLSDYGDFPADLVDLVDRLMSREPVRRPLAKQLHTQLLKMQIDWLGRAG